MSQFGSGMLRLHVEALTGRQDAAAGEGYL